MTNGLNLKIKKAKILTKNSVPSNLEEFHTKDNGFKNWAEFEVQNKDHHPSTIEVFSRRDDGLVQWDTFGDQQNTVDDQAREVQNEKYILLIRNHN